MSGTREAHGVSATSGGGHSSMILSISCGEPGCDRAFGSEAARDSHRTYQHGLGKDPIAFNCRVSTCTASFGTELNRDEHMREAHRPPRERSASEPPVRVMQPHRLDAAVAANAPSSAGTVVRAPDAGPGVDDTSGGLPEDAGSSPAPRSKDEPAESSAGHEEEAPMATKYLCTEPGCDRSFDKQQALTMHVTRTHRGLGGAPRGSKRKTAAQREAPSRVQPNGHRRGDPAKHLVVIKLDELQLEGLVELVRDAGGSVDLSDPADLRREAGRMELLAVLQEASPA